MEKLTAAYIQHRVDLLKEIHSVLTFRLPIFCFLAAIIHSLFHNVFIVSLILDILGSSIVFVISVNLFQLKKYFWLSFVAVFVIIPGAFIFFILDKTYISYILLFIFFIIMGIVFVFLLFDVIAWLEDEKARLARYQRKKVQTEIINTHIGVWK